MGKNQNKKVKEWIIVSLLLIFISFIVYLFITTVPSEELVNLKVAEFNDTLSNNKIKKMTVYIDDEFGKIYKIVIKDKNVINEIVNASTVNHGIYTPPRGGFAQHYLIRLDLGNRYYNYAYCKMDKVSPTECQRKYINEYNDCGRIELLNNTSFKKEVRPVFLGVAQLLNIDLIPVLRKYVDEKKDKEPDKYYYPLDE